MSERQFQFRTAAFGGFQKQDVLNFVEASAKEHGAKVEPFTKELEQLRTEREASTQELQELTERLAQVEEENSRLTAELTQRTGELSDAVTARDQLRAEAAQLRRQVERLEPLAAAYETVKERTAGIELEAHGRAQAIERTAKEKARKAQLQLVEWLDKVGVAYGRLRSELESTLAQAAGDIQKVEKSLGDMSSQFASHDDALKSMRHQMEALDSPKAPEPLQIEERKESQDEEK